MVTLRRRNSFVSVVMATFALMVAVSPLVAGWLNGFTTGAQGAQGTATALHSDGGEGAEKWS